MKYRYKFIVALVLVITLALNPSPALSFFPTNLNFLISGSVQLRRQSWTNFRVVNAPTLLELTDNIRGSRSTEAVVLCSDLRRRTIVADSSSPLSAICPQGRVEQFIDNEAGDYAPTSEFDDPENEDTLPQMRFGDIEGLQPPITYSSNSNDNNSGETDTSGDVSTILDAISDIEMSDEVRAFVIAQTYIQYGLLADAINTLETISSSASESASGYQLLGDIYRELGVYDKAESSYEIALSIFEEKNDYRAFLYSLNYSSVDSQRYNGDLEKKAEALLGLGRISLANGNYADAVRKLRQAQLLYYDIEGARSATAEALDPSLLEGIIEDRNSLPEEQVADYLGDRIDTGTVPSVRATIPSETIDSIDLENIIESLDDSILMSPD